MIEYFLPTIIALGIITSWEDIKEGKIRNKYVVAALILSTITHALLYFFGIINTGYIVRMSIYVFIALLIGFLIWYIKWWSAGDAKLYIAFIALIPLTSYQNLSINFPIFVLLINTITPLFVFYLVKLFVKTNNRQKLKTLKKVFNWKFIINLLLTVFALGWLFSLIFARFGIAQNIIYSIFGIMILAILLRKIFEDQTIHLLILISILRIFLSSKYILKPEFWITFVLMALGYAALRIFIDELSEIYTKKVNLYDLKEDMIATQAISKEGHRINLGKDRYSLTKQDIKTMQNAHRKGRLHFNTIKVQETIPFALFLFLGTILTLVFQGNFIVFLRLLF